MSLFLHSSTADSRMSRASRAVIRSMEAKNQSIPDSLNPWHLCTKIARSLHDFHRCSPLSFRHPPLQSGRSHEPEMIISLSPIKYQLFLRRISATSPARSTLAKAKEIYVQSSRFSNKWVIVCDRSNAVALLKAAMESFPEALPEIEIAFKHDRFYWS